MAGDWIKVEHALPEKPEVVAIAAATGIDRFAVVGRLHTLWSWFDKHTEDGNARGVTQAFLDSLVALDGFASALESVGWLSIRNGMVSMPNFDRHQSKSAKRRALGQERSQRFRNAPIVTPPLPEKRREEKRRGIAAAEGMDRGVQGGKDFAAAMRRGMESLCEEAGIAGDSDQVGFFARLAFAGASGFKFPRATLEYAREAKGKANPAGWLTTTISGDCGPERWQAFLDATPAPNRCQEILAGGES